MSLSGVGLGSSSSSYMTGDVRLQRYTAGLRSSSAGHISNDSISLSEAGQFIGKLQALQASDPQKFKEVVSRAADELQTAARQAGDTPQGRSLADLSQKFRNIANGGDISQLKPTAQTNRVQKAYGVNQPGSVQGLLNLLGQNQATSGTDPNYVMKSVSIALNKASAA